MSTIHRGFASDGETMAARKRHLKKSVDLVDTTDRSVFYLPDKMFTKHDAESLYFPHSDALIMKLKIARCFVKRRLIDTGNLVDIIFLSTLRHMKVDEREIENITFNFVGFNREPSAIIGRVVMPISTRRTIVYLKMMVVDNEKIHCFAWISRDMPRIDSKIITHKLNFDPSYKPVKQKRI